jgi:tetratricopeptide (TPR) repeat protein
MGWPSPNGASPNPAFIDALSALPSPAAWAQMEIVLRGRLSNNKRSTKDRALLAMVEWLRGGRNQASIELSSIDRPTAEMSVLRAKIQLDGAFLDERPDSIEPALRKLIGALNAEPQRPGLEQSIELPDLDRLIGPARARKLLAEIFLTFDGEIVVKRADPFALSARRLALDMAAKLKHPQWTLVTALDGGPLFEVLHRRFPNPITGNPAYLGGDGYHAAAMRYVMFLVANDRSADAATFLKGEEPDRQGFDMTFFEESSSLQRRGKLNAFLQFLEREIANGESGWVINSYYSLCQQIGLAKRADAFVAKLPAAKRSGFFYQVDKPLNDLVAAGKLEEAGLLIVGRIMASTAMVSDPNACSELIDIGRALKRPDWVEFGIATAEKAYRNATFGFPEDWICLELAEHGRAVEAESLVADVLQRRVHDGSNSSPPNGQFELLTLMRVYATAGRWQDLLTILEEAPNLGENDVAFLQNSDWQMDSASYLTAKALAAVGRREEALHVIRYVLQSEPDNDGAFAMLLKLDPVGAGARLDAMRRALPMAPRPRAWKAEWLRRNHKLAAAERTVREAIALDPDDTVSVGYQSRVRFRAWQILADIEQDEGKSAKAAADRRALVDQGQSPTRIDLDLDGPAKRAKALAKNPKDFMARLAVADDLEHAGKATAAEEMRTEAAQQAANELGPASSTEWAGNRAAVFPLLVRVLSEEAATHPGRASTFAALGALCEGLEEWAKAKEAYFKAVALDGNHLAAWKRLMEIHPTMSFSRELEETLVSNLARLSPGDLAQARWEARNLAGVWSAADAALSDLPPVEEPIFRLRASSLGNSADPMNNEGTRSRARPPTAGLVIAGDRTIVNFALLIGAMATHSEGGVK